MNAYVEKITTKAETAPGSDRSVFPFSFSISMYKGQIEYTYVRQNRIGSNSALSIDSFRTEI